VRRPEWRGVERSTQRRPSTGWPDFAKTPAARRRIRAADLCHDQSRDCSPALTTAGLWDEWRDRASGETLKSCTMIITKPNEFVAELIRYTPPSNSAARASVPASRLR
jgi:putative SOS response-associated peptidase YedK